jgi:hypothetical protein
VLSICCVLQGSVALAVVMARIAWIRSGLMLLVTAAFALAGAASGWARSVEVAHVASASAAPPGFEYKVAFQGAGSATFTDSTPANGSGSATGTETDTWTLQPAPSYIWLPKFNGPPGVAFSTTSAFGDYANPSGQVKESGTLSGSNGSGTYRCSGAFQNQISGTLTAEVSELTPHVTLTSDWVGRFWLTEQSCDLQTSAGLMTCSTQSCFPPPAIGGYCWAGPGATPGPSTLCPNFANQQMETGGIIPAFEIGQKSISLIADDYSNVTVPSNCRWTGLLGGGMCSFTSKFALSGSYQLTLVCGGTANPGGSGATGGTCGGGGPGSSGNPNGQNGGGGGSMKCKVPKLVGLSLEEARKKLHGTGCALGKVTHKPSKHFKRGEVLSQTPKAGRVLPHGAKVDLTISNGK